LKLISSIVKIVKPLAFDAIGKGLQNMTGASSSLKEFEQPLGDPGLFGPHSVVWKVHADFSAMMVGGLSSLMIQALHPRALAAVWDHSKPCLLRPQPTAVLSLLRNIFIV